jgi:flagellar M-ring protein FliF
VCFAALTLLLVPTVVKPMSRHMMTALSQTPALALPAPTGTQSGARAAGAKTFGAPGGPGGPSFVLPAKRPNDTQGIYEHISEQIRREPAQSTRLLESWINAPAEEED